MDACIMFAFPTCMFRVPTLTERPQVPSYSRATMVRESQQLSCAPAHDCRIHWTYVSRFSLFVSLVESHQVCLCSAHAALSPWEGQNALDAAVLAYTNISVLRQQLKPSHRVHGIFEGKDWAPNSTCFPLRID